MFARTSNYSNQFYSAPYAFLAAPGARSQTVPRLLPGGGLAGVGACCASCADHKPCAGKGVGLFEDPLNFATWGVGEYAIAAIGAYALVSMFVTTRSAARSVAEGGRRVRRASRALRGA
jgi:hypothetical protein